MNLIFKLSLLCAASAIVSELVIAETKKNPPTAETTLIAAVKDLNSRAKKDPIGATQEPLTKDEVIAAIRLWDRQTLNVDDRTYAIF